MNRYIYIGNDLIAGPVEKDKPNALALTWDSHEILLEQLRDWKTYIASLPKIEVVKEPTHSWEINKILVEDVDVEIKHYPRCDDPKCDCKNYTEFIAVPISKPNTDVKDDAKYEWFNGDNWLNIYDIDKFKKDYPNATIRVKEGERLYSKEDMIGYPDWILDNGFEREEIGKWRKAKPSKVITIPGGNLGRIPQGYEYYTTEQLFNLYLSSSPEVKNNQL